jgi:hypothetical protein
LVLTSCPDRVYARDRLPDGIGNLVRVGHGMAQSVNLSYNRLESLPADFWKISRGKVKSVKLSHNRLTQLPPNFEKVKLLIIDLAHNRFESFPPTLDFKHLRADLTDNPIPEKEQARLRALWTGEKKGLKF